MPSYIQNSRRSRYETAINIKVRVIKVLVHVYNKLQENNERKAKKKAIDLKVGRVSAAVWLSL